MFAADHSVIGVRVRRNRSVVVVDPNFEIADFLAGHLIVGRVLGVSQYRLFRGPDSAAEAARPIVGITLFEEG